MGEKKKGAEKRMLEEDVMVNVTELSHCRFFFFFFPAQKAEILLMKISNIDRKFVAKSHFCIISNGKKGDKTASLRLVDVCVCVCNHLF